MKGGTLFSGICAPETAMPGIDWRWRAEIDPFASAVAAARHPGIPNLGSVLEIDPDAVEPVDLLVFGSPCQSFSIAGKRGGLDDPRGNLTLVGFGLAGRLRPRWVVWENVPGVLSDDGGRTFGAVLGLLGQLGYGFAYRVLDAQHFGIPQRRRRVFIVGHLGDWRPAAAVLFEPESLRGDSPPRREAGQGVAGTIAPGAHPGGYNGQVAHTGQLIAHSLRAEGFDASEDGTGRGTPLVPVGQLILSNQGSGGNRAAYAGVPPAVAFNWQSGGDCHGLDPQPVTGALSRERTPAMLHGTAVRRVTPREAERLQGFPDDYTAVTYRGKPAADGPRYRALGNSMAVPVMRWILSRVHLCDDTLRQIDGEAA